MSKLLDRAKRQTWLFALIGVVGSSLIADVVGEWIPGQTPRIALGAVLVLIALWTLSRAEQEQMRPELRYADLASRNPKRALIVTLTGDASNGQGTQAILAAETPDWELAFAAHPIWPWEMTLRAVHANLGRKGAGLQHVVLIGTDSAGKHRGSAEDLPTFAAILRKLTPHVQVHALCEMRDRVRVRRLDADNESAFPAYRVDVEDIHDLRRAYDLCYEHVVDVLKVPPHDICIDFTSATKTNSAAVIATTINRDCQACIVGTNSKEVRLLDFIVKPDTRVG